VIWQAKPRRTQSSSVVVLLIIVAVVLLTFSPDASPNISRMDLMAELQQSNFQLPIPTATRYNASHPIHQQLEDAVPL
jgi:hypothetical protein